MVQETWNKYADEHKSSSVKSALKNTMLSLDDSTILIKVPSDLIMEKVLAESLLMECLRKEFKEDISLKFEKNANLFPDYKTIPVKRYLTNEDKFEALVEKNPNLETLVQRFGLKMDNK